MKAMRAILTGTLVWVLGVVVFTVSYFVPLMNDLDMQANIALSVSVIPFAWLGARIYYRKDNKTHGLKVGACMVLTAMILDSIFTVPLLVIPGGGDYSSFFIDPGFWIIVFEYLMVVMLYWRLKVQASFIHS